MSEHAMYYIQNESGAIFGPRTLQECAPYLTHPSWRVLNHNAVEVDATGLPSRYPKRPEMSGYITNKRLTTSFTRNGVTVILDQTINLPVTASTASPQASQTSNPANGGPHTQETK